MASDELKQLMDEIDATELHPGRCRAVALAGGRTLLKARQQRQGEEEPPALFSSCSDVLEVPTKPILSSSSVLDADVSGFRSSLGHAAP